MNPIDVVVLQCGSDAKKSAVSTMNTHLKIGLRGARKATRLTVIDVEAPEFKLDETRIREWIASKAVLLIMVTPSMLAVDEMIGDNMKALARVASDNGIRILPVYAIKVPNPSRTPWCQFSWAPWAKHGDNQPLSSGNLDGQCCEVVEGIVAAVEKEPKVETAAGDSTLASRRGTGATESTVATDKTQHDATPRKRDVRDYKVPPLAVFTCSADEHGVREALDPVLALLGRERNVRAYTRWDVPSGATWERHEMLGSRAPVVVITLSSNSIADDRVFNVIKQLTPDQDVIFVLLSACLWEILSISHLKQVVLPTADSQPVEVDGFSKGRKAAWQQVASALLARFPGRLADEDAGTLNTTEAQVESEFERRRQAQEAIQRRPDPDFDIVKAYWEK